MAWIEMTLGLALDDNGTRLRRATPLDLSAAAAKLAADTARRGQLPHPARIGA